MDKLTLYLKESYHELTKNVSWPTTAQLIESTIVVLVTSLILTFFIFTMDQMSGFFFKNIYNAWGSSSGQ